METNAQELERRIVALEATVDTLVQQFTKLVEQLRVLLKKTEGGR